MDESDTLIERLQTVFDVCDTEKRGYITVEHFVELAGEHFGTENGDETLWDIVQVLDSEGDGKIYFSEFCSGVQQILQRSGPSSPVGPLPNPFGFAESQLHGAAEILNQTEEDAASSGTHDTSELSTFNEYDMLTDDDQVVCGSGARRTHVFLTSEEEDATCTGHNHRCMSESFEDYGEAHDASPTDPSTPVTDVHKSPGDNDCEHAKRPRLSSDEDSWYRRVMQTQRISQTWPRGRVSTNALANQLFRPTASSENTSRRSSCSDEIFQDIDGNFSELNDKVCRLESQIHVLTETSSKKDERQSRLRDENSFFVERIHTLEEQLRDVEVRASSRLQEEQRKCRELSSRAEKNQTHEIDIMQLRLQQVEKEYTALKEDSPRLRSELERLRKENAQLEEQVCSSQQQLSQLLAEHSELQRRLTQQKQDTDTERSVNAQLVDELGKELEELRIFKLENEGRQPATPTAVQPNLYSQTILKKLELEAHIIRLKEDNARLQDSNDDLHAQLLRRQIEEGRNLLHAGQGNLSEELDSLPRDQLLTALREQKEANDKLRDYMDQLTLRIMEKNPTLLEIDKQTNAITDKPRFSLWKK